MATELLLDRTEDSSQRFLKKFVKRLLPESFSQKENFKSFIYCVLNLGVIISLGNIAWNLGRIDFYILAFFIVGARAQALYILQHECMHWLLFSNRKLNDFFGMLISGSIGTVLLTGRVYHFKHHRELGQLSDPNEIFHGTSDKMPGAQALKYFASQLLGGRIFRSLVGILFKSEKGNKNSNLSVIDKMKKDLVAICVCQSIILIIFLTFSSFWAYVLLFLLPIVTLTAFFETVRSFSEHVLPSGCSNNPAEELRLFYMKSNFVETFFISQFNFNYHHLHHTYPNVVTFKLKKLHNFLQENDREYSSSYVERPSYLGVMFNYILNRDFSGHGLNYPFRNPKFKEETT